MRIKVGQRFIDPDGNYLIIEKLFSENGVEKARVNYDGKTIDEIVFVLESAGLRLATQLEVIVYEN